MDHLQIARAITKLLDKQFRIGKMSFGLDPILGLIPGIGDVLSLILSLYVMWIARNLEIPERYIAQMTRNIIFDFVLGIIPVVGDLSDFVFKANSKNLEILERYLREEKRIIDGKLIT
jgi:hypothetical protein